jgi:hypothetical protein
MAKTPPFDSRVQDDYFSEMPGFETREEQTKNPYFFAPPCSLIVY